MKRIVLLTVICCMLMCSLSAFATAENIIIDGTTVTIPEDMGKIVEKDDRTFVPIRFVSEYLGCTVDYKESPERAIIFEPSTRTSYLIMPNDDKIFVLPNFGNGSMITMNTNVFVNNEESRMYIPIRFFAQAIGYDVAWDEETLTVSMTKQVEGGDAAAPAPTENETVEDTTSQDEATVPTADEDASKGGEN